MKQKDIKTIQTLDFGIESCQKFCYNMQVFLDEIPQELPALENSILKSIEDIMRLKINLSGRKEILKRNQ